jgi:hypothetical protein
VSEPIVFISHNRVKQGKLEAFKASVREFVPVIEREKPETVVFLGYTNEDGTQAQRADPRGNARVRHERGRVPDRLPIISAGTFV